MFKKRENLAENADVEYTTPRPVEPGSPQKRNSILRGSKLTGDIVISCDLELDGDVEGNITSEDQSNVVIKGNCKGSINVKEGSVSLEGQMSDGDIVAGGNVSVSGTFKGGKIDAQGTISVNGRFNGTLKGREIEIGPNAQGSGELIYRDSVSISKGANVEAEIKKSGDQQKKQKEKSGMKVVNIEPAVSEAMTAGKG